MAAYDDGGAIVDGGVGGGGAGDGDGYAYDPESVSGGEGATGGLAGADGAGDAYGDPAAGGDPAWAERYRHMSDYEVRIQLAFSSD